MRWIWLAVVMTACSSPGSTPGDAALDAEDVDAAPDATVTTGTFSTPVVLAVPPPTDTDDDVTLTGDLRELYINSARNGNYDVFVLKRANITDAWGPLVLVPFVSTLGVETTPKVHPDGLSMTFARDPSSTGIYELWLSTRPSRTDAWKPAVEMTELNTTASDNGASMTADRRTVVLASTRNGADFELFIADRASPDVPFEMPVPITAANSTLHDGSPWISADGLTLYFESTRDGDSDFYIARRTSRTEAFGAAEQITELSSPVAEQDIWVSPDGRYVTFTSNRNGTNQIWEAAR